jgi:hypothetical protein
MKSWFKKSPSVDDILEKEFSNVNKFSISNELGKLLLNPFDYDTEQKVYTNADFILTYKRDMDIVKLKSPKGVKCYICEQNINSKSECFQINNPVYYLCLNCVNSILIKNKIGFSSTTNDKVIFSLKRYTKRKSPKRKNSKRKSPKSTKSRRKSPKRQNSRNNKTKKSPKRK